LHIDPVSLDDGLVPFVQKRLSVSQRLVITRQDGWFLPLEDILVGIQANAVDLYRHLFGQIPLAG
jgi:hypothetical protein